MFVLKRIWCRVFQMGFRGALPVLPYRQPSVLSSCAELGRVLKAEHIKGVLIVTDAGIVRNRLTEPLQNALAQNGIAAAIFDKTQPNPTTDNVRQALRMYREHHCEGLVAIGGGSSIDCAKAVGACLAYPGKRLEQMAGVMRVLRKIPTLVAIPTTAGTGSEATVAAVITDSETRHKYALMSFPLIPHYAVLDAALTYTLPPHLTATTGMDALTHAVEAYIGRSTTKQTRALALEATRLVFENIQRAYTNGCDHQARENMLMAAHQAGIAFSMSYVGYIHAIAHSLGGCYGTPHGLANAVIMPYVLEGFGPCVYEKLHELAMAAGISTREDSHQKGAEAFVAAIRMLNDSMGIPRHITGIREEDIGHMAKYAEAEANPLYPVPKLMTREELEVFYRQAGNLARGISSETDHDKRMNQ